MCRVIVLCLLTCTLTLFLGPGPSALPVYGLDSTDPMEWQEKVSTPALAVVEAFIKVYVY